MEKFMKLNKKGASPMSIGLGVLMAVVVATVIWSADGLADTTFVANAPGWLVSIMGFAAAFALIKSMTGSR